VKVLWRIGILHLRTHLPDILSAFAIFFLKKMVRHANGYESVGKIVIFLTGIFYRVHYEKELDRIVHTFSVPIIFLFGYPTSALAMKHNWRFMAKEELGNIPVLNIFFQEYRYTNNRANARSVRAEKKSQRRLHKGMSIVIFFPKKTIGRIHQSCPFKKDHSPGNSAAGAHRACYDDG